MYGGASRIRKRLLLGPQPHPNSFQPPLNGRLHPKLHTRSTSRCAGKWTCRTCNPETYNPRVLGGSYAWGPRGVLRGWAFSYERGTPGHQEYKPLCRQVDVSHLKNVLGVDQLPSGEWVALIEPGTTNALGLRV